jgi:hypothetical protein
MSFRMSRDLPYPNTRPDRGPGYESTEGTCPALGEPSECKVVVCTTLPSAHGSGCPTLGDPSGCKLWGCRTLRARPLWAPKKAATAEASGCHRDAEILVVGSAVQNQVAEPLAADLSELGPTDHGLTAAVGDPFGMQGGDLLHLAIRPGKLLHFDR